MTQHDRLGKYQIIEVLGKGAMGVVFKGFDPGIDRTVAIKTVRKELIEDDGRAGMALARFRNEARAAGRLSHPGIVAVYDYGESAEITYIAMEFVQGNSLREYFNRGTRFEEPDIASIMAQLLEALQHAHDAGVWHRDIKPANLIIMNNGRLKVADFGIARIEASQLTQTGVVMGSPGYMAPEQYSGGTVDWRADLFAAGVVMHQLLTGERLFTGSAEQLAYKICHVQPPLPSEVAPGRGWERYDPILVRALAKNPAERFQSARDFRDAVLNAYAQPVNTAVSEETIIAESLAPAAVFEPSSPSARTGDRPLAHGSASGPPTRPLPPLQSQAQEAPASVADPSRTRWLIGAGIVSAVVVGAVIGGWLASRGSGQVALPAQRARTSIAEEPTAPPLGKKPATSPPSASVAHVPVKAQVQPHEAEPAASKHTEPAARKPAKPKPAPTKPPRQDAARPVRPAPIAKKVEAPKPVPVLEQTPVPAPTPSPTKEVAKPAPAPAAPPPVAAASAPEAKPPAPKPPETSIWRDQGITMKVASRIQFNRRLWSSGIQVETVAGIVTLRGAVGSQAQSDEAEKLASAVPGVVAVKNEIKVTP